MRSADIKCAVQSDGSVYGYYKLGDITNLGIIQTWERDVISMKRWTVTAAIIALTLVLTPAIGSAGTWLGGVKYWYVTWDSGIMDWLNEDLAISFQENGLPLDVDREAGSGFLAGPLLGYQSDDGKWSASIAPMLISSITQNWSASGPVGITMDVNDKTTLDRVDIDIAFNYNLTDSYKLFAGLKYQDVVCVAS